MRVIGLEHKKCVQEGRGAICTFLKSCEVVRPPMYKRGDCYMQTWPVDWADWRTIFRLLKRKIQKVNKVVQRLSKQNETNLPMALR